MFINRLNVTLTLKIGSKSFAIPAGNIKNFELQLHSYGFEAAFDFWLVSQKSEKEDTLYAEFVKDDLVTASVTLDRTFDKVGAETETLKLTGLVEEKEMRERAFQDLSGGPVLHRRYAIKFRDRAAVAWSQHRPVQVWADQTFKKVVDDHKPQGLKLKHDWTGSSTKIPVLSVGVGADPDGAHFYDYVNWLCAREGLGLFVDFATEQYTLSDKKPRTKKILALPEDDVELLDIVFPPVPRFAVRVLNGYSEASTKKKDVPNKLAVTNVRQDRLLIAPVARDVTDRAKDEKSAVTARDESIRVTFGRFPSVTVRPNLVYDLSDGWSDRVHLKKKKFRIRTMTIIGHAENQGATENTDDDSNAYKLDVEALFEPQTSKSFCIPSFRRPHWPFLVEGKIVSTVGKKEELTYQSKKDSKTSRESYTVLIPVWNQKVIVPYEPGYQPGHFYFPAYKDERVRLAVYPDRADLERFLDWRPGARLPAETQGNHLLLGKKDKDQTSISHTYVKAKPVLTIDRTLAKDTQHIEISEGRIFLKTEEKK